MSYCMTNCKNCNKTIAHLYLAFRKYIIKKVENRKDLDDNTQFFKKYKIITHCCRTQIITCLLDPPMEEELLKNSFYKNFINYNVQVI